VKWVIGCVQIITIKSSKMEKSQQHSPQQRLKIMLAELGISKAEFARKTGISPQVLQKIQTGKNGISNKVAGSITATYPQYPLTWLLSGYKQAANGVDLSQILQKLAEIEAKVDILLTGKPL
jgi:transcriptional regulator with XRE-family HTH domain